MTIPQEFDEIRPFEAEDLPAAFERLSQQAQFQAVLAYIYPHVPFQALMEKMKNCHSGLEFQKTFCYGFINELLAKAAKQCDMCCDALDINGRYTFISNHRDIVLDSALLSKFLLDAGFSTTCEIAIGDNLLALPWVKDLVRVNKSFIVERGLPMRQMLSASKRLSGYMHFAINKKHENIWIAQREGRAKDSDDRTQEAVLKMMAMSGEGSVVERLMELHLAPLSISYEYDPCDYLKAKEFQLKRDIPGWKKSAADDVLSMKTGILGYKGNIHYHVAPCIDNFLANINPATPKTDLYMIIAKHIDQEIHRHYRLYANNYVALDLLEGTDTYACHYTLEEKKAFEKYVEERIGMVDLENKDEAFLRERILTMYANPARNYLLATHQK